MWLTAIGMGLGLLGIRAFVRRGWRGPHDYSLGWMNQQWLAEHRAGSR